MERPVASIMKMLHVQRVHGQGLRREGPPAAQPLKVARAQPHGLGQLGAGAGDPSLRSLGARFNAQALPQAPGASLLIRYRTMFHVKHFGVQLRVRPRVSWTFVCRTALNDSRETFFAQAVGRSEPAPHVWCGHGAHPGEVRQSPPIVLAVVGLRRNKGLISTKRHGPAHSDLRAEDFARPFNDSRETFFAQAVGWSEPAPHVWCGHGAQAGEVRQSPPTVLVAVGLRRNKGRISTRRHGPAHSDLRAEADNPGALLDGAGHAR